MTRWGVVAALGLAELGIFAAMLSISRSAGHDWPRSLLESFLATAVLSLVMREGVR